jgi:BMFP domain-containing protein YqiC
MTQSNRILDDVSRLVTDMAGAAQGLRREAETVARGQLERILRDMDLVTREEFDAQRDIAVAARDEADRLSGQVSALEARLAALETKLSRA